MKMNSQEYRFLVRCDLHRYAGNASLSSFVYHYLLSPGFQFSFWLRTARYLRDHRVFRYLLFPIVRLILLHCEYKYGISISDRTQIGPGLYIGHFGGIVVNQHVVIGRNCNLSQQTTLGVVNRGPSRGYPVIGDNVYIGPGAVVMGKIQVGDDVAIGANCVLTHSVGDGSVVVGVPGKVISSEGSAGYINRTDYETREPPKDVP